MKKKLWIVLLCVVSAAAVAFGGAMWWRANIPSQVFDEYPEKGSSLDRYWAGWQLENARTNFSNYIEEDTWPHVYNKDARIAVYVTKDCPYTEAYFRRAIRCLKYAQLRLVRVEHSVGEFAAMEPEIDEVVFGDQFAVRSIRVTSFDSVVGWRYFIGVDGPDAEAAKAYLEENYKGYVAVLPRRQITSYDPELLDTNGRTGSSRKYLAPKN